MLASAGANGCSSRESKRQKTSASGGDAVIEDIDSGGDWKAKTSSNTFAPGLMREEFKFITRQFKFLKKLIGFGKKEEAGPGVDSSSFAVDATLVPGSGKGHPGALCRQDSLRDDGCNRLRVPGLCLETATVREAAQLMESGRHSALLITHADGTLAGILTERDILRRVASVGRDADATRVQDVMTSDPDFITLETSAMEALSMMLERRYRHLPVVEVESAGAVASTSTIARPPLRPVALVGAFFNLWFMSLPDQRLIFCIHSHSTPDILSLTFTSAASVIEASSSKVHSEKAEVEAAPTSEHAADAASAASAAAAAADASGIKTAASASAMASGPFARARDALDAIAALTAKGLRSARISKFEGSDGAGAHFKKARRKALVAQRLIQRLSQSGTAEAKENVAELSLRFLALQLWSLHNHGQIQVFTNMVSDGVSTLEVCFACAFVAFLREHSTSQLSSQRRRLRTHTQIGGAEHCKGCGQAMWRWRPLCRCASTESCMPRGPVPFFPFRPVVLPGGCANGFGRRQVRAGGRGPLPPSYRRRGGAPPLKACVGLFKQAGLTHGFGQGAVFVALLR